jgi:hypothetical protein
MRRLHRDIPAFLSIDVEPDGFQYPNLAWTGFESLQGLVARMRSELAAVSGVTPRFSWYLRMDPQVTEVHGRPDYLAVAYADVLARLEREGDVFGSHVHPLRWSPDRECWVHEFADDDWTEHCIESSFEAFAKAFGDPPARHRYGGGGFIDNCVVASLDEHGVRLDLTLEPGIPSHPLAAMHDARTGIDASPRTAPMTNCRRVPRRPYQPSRDDFRRVGGGDRRRLVLVPLSSTRLRYDRPWWRQAAGTVKRGSRPLHVMRMHNWHRSPKAFWDCAAQHLRVSARPYLSLAIRTDAPGSGSATRVRALLEHLPRHPIARRLCFVDPLDVVPDLLTT